MANPDLEPRGGGGGGLFLLALPAFLPSAIFFNPKYVTKHNSSHNDCSNFEKGKQENIWNKKFAVAECTPFPYKYFF